MATIDDILNGNGGGAPPAKGSAEWSIQQTKSPSKNPPKGSYEWAEQQNGGSTSANPPKGSQDWAEQNSGNNAPPALPAVKSKIAQPAAQAQKSSTLAKPAQGSSFSYEDLYKKLNPYRPPTPEEVEKEKKKYKREQIFNAIGDGLYAFSNLFFTTQYAPNMHKEGNNMTERAQVRYDKMIKDREENNLAYYNGIIRAKQADERKSEAERAWERQLGLDAERKRQRDEELKHRAEREKLADDRYAAEQEYRKGRDKDADDKWQKQFQEGQRRANQQAALAEKKQADYKDLQEKRITATAARGVRGKQLGFSDGDGNQVSIYENVWKGSMQQVYDVLAEDMKAAHEADRQNNPRVLRHRTEKEKEDFVKQNWHKSPRAASIMLALSQIDPATMHSEIVEEEEIEDYDPNGGSDDVIDYVPGKQ